jgi:hypothetical protein
MRINCNAEDRLASMKYVLSAAAPVLLVCAVVLSRPAPAQAWEGLENEMVAVRYVEPTNEKYKPLYRRLKERKILEQFNAFLSPLRRKRHTASLLFMVRLFRK